MPRRRRQDGPKAIGREQGSRLIIVDPDGSRVIEHGRSDRGQLTVAHPDTISRVEPVNPGQGHRPGRAQPQHRQGVGRQPGAGRGVKNFLKAAGMFGIIVGKPHPSQVRRINDRRQRLHEWLTRNSHAGVNEDWLFSLDDEGIDRQESHAGNREIGRQDVDIRPHLIGLENCRFIHEQPSFSVTSSNRMRTRL